MPEFASIERSRRINNRWSDAFTNADLEAELVQGGVYQVGPQLRLEGFRKSGVNMFGISRELFVELHQYKYALGSQQGRPSVEKLYHQRLTKEEVKKYVEAWCEAVIDEMLLRFKETVQIKIKQEQAQ